MSDTFQDAFVTLQRAAGKLMGDVAALLKPYGLSHPQYNALRILRGARGAGLHCGEIAERMIHREPDMTRLLDRLESAGLIERARGTADRRTVTATITRAGLKLLKSLDQPVLALHARQFSTLGETRTAALSRGLNLLLEDAHPKGCP